MKKRKICIVTGTRAEYGLLYWLMKDIENDKAFKLQIIATGMHLSTEFGLTYKEIEKDGFQIDKKVEMLLSLDTPSAISKSTGLGLIGFSDALNDLAPDIVIVLGDRFEVFSAALAATFARIPFAHIHGGESTEGVIDEAIRHSITKMAWWHFVAAKEYEKRVLQLGENPKQIFNVGGLGVDSIKRTKFLSKRELEANIGVRFLKKNLLVTFHPVTLEKNSSKENFEQLLEVLTELKDCLIIFTMPNADSFGRVIKEMIHQFVSNNSKNYVVFDSMGRLNYLSTLQFVDGMIGNSSSGLLEAPSFKIGTINIGDRQKGRLKSKSIIDCDPSKESILKGIKKLYSKDFQKLLSTVVNPYGDGSASEKIIEVLKNDKIPAELKKEFHNL
ncbi:MAG: UDP-N-acetylglucosamine 2-epimerase (hydrolyzing) [Candidatus Marinimicrobia bacterium]|nr:UDP-N-acetylglucosamine 2-epimerase (hydrolyzing) [Candidatus Neomarinimicrobiota bacterium]|tara:strand:+ start:27551 stop:28711 length:1161 start_codon:yes stop_codon:yes gene_type:complete